METRSTRVTRSTNLKAQKDNPPTGYKTASTTRKAKSARLKLEKTEVADTHVGGNMKGLPTFPDELLLEVLSYYPTPPESLSTEASDYRAVDAIEHAARRDTLLALSQTCRSLRRFFRPYVWCRIEVCAGMCVGDGVLESWGRMSSAVNRMYNAELVRQLEIVTVRDPSLAEYVKLINVEVRDYSIPSVLAELARCMTLFPNLRLVKLDIPRSKRRASTLAILVKKAFSPYLYPQIDLVIVSKSAYPLLRSCPSVRSVGRMDGYAYPYPSDGFWECVQSFCPRLESITMHMLGGDAEEILRVLPNLRMITLRFNTRFYIDASYSHKTLEKLKHLQNIKIVVTTSVISSTDRQHIVDWAVRFLQKLQKEDKEEKEVSLRYIHMFNSKWEYTTKRICIPVPQPWHARPIQ